MKPRDNPFKISALNSLNIHQVYPKNQKQLTNTFKGATDLREQLNKTKNSSISKYKKSLINNTITAGLSSQKFAYTTGFGKQKPQQQALMDEVAALDNFKVPVTRDKTKNLIQNIKLRRREKHIQAYNGFKEDLDDYKENLLAIYENVLNDCTQVLNIKQAQLLGYLNSQTDKYLLGRQKQLITELQTQFQDYKQSTEYKIKSIRQQLDRIKVSRQGVVDETCTMLREKLIQIAFVLEDEARQIQNKQKQQIIQLEENYYDKFVKQINSVEQKQLQQNGTLQLKLTEVIKRWRQLKEDYQVEEFELALKSQQYLNPNKRKKLYLQIVALQKENHEKKLKNLESLVENQHVDSLKKQNIQKWNEVLKAINDIFDKKLDQLVKQLMQEYQQNKQKHENLVKHLEERLKYIQNHTNEQIENDMLQSKYRPSSQDNVKQAQQQMKSVTNYLQKNDQKQNKLYESLYSKLFTLIAIKNDQFVKEFNAEINQKYELNKAKILDDDEELIEKLQTELSNCKKQLRESLHHIKLEEVQKRCFEKIDEIEQAYRQTHEKNKELIAARPGILNKFFTNFQSQMAKIFQLYEQSKRVELVQKNKEQSQKQAMRRIQDEDKKKAQEQARQTEQIIKKGGKAPPAAKPKDPKKLATEIEQRKKLILTQMGEKKIEQLKMSSGNVWLIYKSLEEICTEFYEQQKNQENVQPSQADPKPVDHLPEIIKDVEGNSVTTDQSILKIPLLAQKILFLRDAIFKNIDEKKGRIITQATQQDQQLLDESLMTLDQRLKQHYSLKGELQSQIYVKRSGQITNHKKRYEKYARMIRDKMDTQTERFNFLLQKGLEAIKKHNSEQKAVKEQLPLGKNLSELQGMLSKARQNFNSFTHEVKQLLIQLSRLSNVEVQHLLKKNEDFIKQSKSLNEGGEYSGQQIQWYKQMLKQITDQIDVQRTKRLQKLKQLQDQSDKRKKQLLQKFQKQYNQVIEQLSAKDGTGKKYGKPKRIAQEKVRLQMNKCQQSQIRINKQIDQILSIYQKQKSHNFIFSNRPESLIWRKKLMTLYSCIDRYAKHIEALKPELKIKPMQRVNYDETISECTVKNIEQDKKLLQIELKQLGPLSQQKQQAKTFMKFINDIEKIISDQARTIYVGDKAKYLTGNDKLPDFLRKYIVNMKKSAEDFRQNSARQLRQSCVKLAENSEKFGELLFCSIKNYFKHLEHQNSQQILDNFMKFYNTNEKQKIQNLRQLRPNLSNPKCQSQLKQLNDRQLKRQSDFVQELKKIKDTFSNDHFNIASEFITSFINSYEFLIFFTDSLYLFEDFNKVLGDDEEEKPKVDIKKLMIIKQKGGIQIDSNSQRNLRKKWQGLKFDSINFDDKKYIYKKSEVEESNPKDKKAAKKQTKKDPKLQQAPIVSQSTSRPIQTFKTYRQKSVYTYRQGCLQQFLTGYKQILSSMYRRFDEGLKQNEMFKQKWIHIADQLFLK